MGNGIPDHRSSDKNRPFQYEGASQVPGQLQTCTLHQMISDLCAFVAIFLSDHFPSSGISGAARHLRQPQVRWAKMAMQKLDRSEDTARGLLGAGIVPRPQR